LLFPFVFLIELKGDGIQPAPFFKTLTMNNLSKFFNGLRKITETVGKISKVLRSVELVGQHLNLLVDDLEEVWQTKKATTIKEEIQDEVL